MQLIGNTKPSLKSLVNVIRNNRYNGLLGALNWKMNGVLLDYNKGKSHRYKHFLDRHFPSDMIQ